MGTDESIRAYQPRGSLGRPGYNPAEEDFRDAATDAVKQNGHRNQSGRDIAKARNKIKNWIETETFLNTGNPDQSVHQERNPFECRFG